MLATASKAVSIARAASALIATGFDVFVAKAGTGGKSGSAGIVSGSGKSNTDATEGRSLRTGQ